MLFTRPVRSSLLLLGVVMLAALALGGCALEETPESQHAGSSLPWNRPEKWEGPGVLGSSMQGSR